MGYKREFEPMMGVSVEDFEEATNTYIDTCESSHHVRGMTKAFQNGKRLILIGSSMTNEIYFYNNTILEIGASGTVTTPLPPLDNDMFNSVDSRYIDTPSFIKQKFMIEGMDNRCLAYEDLLGNIYFNDFCFEGMSMVYKEYFLMVLKMVGINTSFLTELQIKKFAKDILAIDSTRIKHIEVQTEIDKEGFLESANKLLKAELSKFSKSNVIKERVFLNRLASERKLHSRKTQAVAESAYMEGLKGLPSGWVIRKHRLYYDLPIYATHALYQGVQVKLPDKRYYIKGLNIAIKQFCDGVACEEAFHPNAIPTDPDFSVCIGDLVGHPLSEGLEKIPSTLTVAGIDNPHGGYATDEVRALFKKTPDNLEMVAVFDSGLRKESAASFTEGIEMPNLAERRT